MKPPILLCMFAMFAYAANAQLTLLPQLGFENTGTSVKYNNLASFSPAGSKLVPQVGLRLDYQTTHGHGAFLGIATSQPVVKLNFSDPQTAMNNYIASKGNTELRLEGGFKVSSKPIYFKKAGSNNNSAKIYYQKNSATKGCGNSAVRNSCGNKTSHATAARPADKGSWVRIQPSIGVAYMTSAPSAEIITKSGATQTSYQYNAGTWKTALMSGIGFEFGRNTQSKFIVSINYLKGLDNQGEKSITTVSANKPATISLKSEASAWNFRVGIPISLGKKKPVAAKQQVIQKIYREGTRCGQYKSCYRQGCGK